MNNIIFSNQHPTLPLPKHNSNTKKKKIDIKQLKNNTISSLNDVENFLDDFHRFKKYIKLYKILK